LAEEASSRLETIPAEYETVTEQVLVQPASERVITVPATYETVTERVLDQPARTEWKRGTGIATGEGIGLGGAAAQITRFEGNVVLETRVAEDTGEVMCLVEIPATYRTLTKQVLRTPATTRSETIPARYETVTKRVLRNAAATREIPIEAKYTTERVRKLVSPASTRVEEIAAEYKTVTRRVVDTPASTREVTIPAEYSTVQKTILTKPATTRTEPIEAEYKTVSRRVVDTPASSREVTIPAEYRTVKVRQMVKPSSERRIPIPAEYTTVTQRNKAKDEYVAWRPVLCEVNMTRQNVSQLQRALYDAGCCCYEDANRCRVDGVMGECTIEASQCYARRNGLTSGDKYITLEVIRHLGLEF